MKEEIIYMKTKRYALIGLPSDMKDLSYFAFTREQVKSNTLWRLGESSLYLLEEDDHTYNIISNRRSRMSIDSRVLTMTKDHYMALIDLFVSKGYSSFFSFDDNDEEEEPEVVDYLNRLSRKVGSQPTSEEGVRLMKELLSSALDEGVSPRSITVNTTLSEKRFGFTLYPTLFLYSNNQRQFDISEIDTFMRNFIVEMVIAFGHEGCHPDMPLYQTRLPVQDYVPHPLRNTKDVLDLLYSSVSDEQLASLGLSDEELKNIRLSLYQRSNVTKDATVTKAMAKNIVNGLQD